MNWILENLQLVVIVASAFAWWLSQRKKPKEDGSEPRAPGEGPVQDLDQHTRRIQEEIRRKIAERRGESPGRPTPPPVPAGRPGWAPAPAAPPPVPRRHVPEWTEADAATLERQQRLDEQMRTLVAQRRAVRDKAQEAFDLPVSPLRSQRQGGAPSALRDRDLLLALRDRRSLRQAIVLREVLGPPVALR